MLKNSFSYILLSLFASTEKASEIEGDLIEQAQSRGQLWFVSHVILTTLSLFRQAFLADPIYISILSYGVYELLFKMNWWGVRRIQFYLADSIGMSSSIVVSKGLWLVLAFMIGTAIVRSLPKFGFQVVIGAVSLVLIRLIITQELPIGIVFIFALLPLLLGSVLAHKRNLEQPFRIKKTA